MIIMVIEHYLHELHIFTCFHVNKSELLPPLSRYYFRFQTVCYLFFLSVCLSVCLLAGLCKYYWLDLHNMGLGLTKTHSILRVIGIKIWIQKKKTRQKVFVHKNKVSLQFVILYEMFKNRCEQVNVIG